jgi:hypothetical protein
MMSRANRSRRISPAHDGTVLVHGADPVRIAVEAYAHLRSLGTDPLDQVLDVLVHRWIRVVVGKRAIGLAIERHHVRAQPLQQLHRHHAAHTVAAIHHDLHGPGQVEPAATSST